MPGQKTFHVESLLSAHLCLCPQIFRGRVYYVSDLSGCLSLYWMPLEGGEPRPLLPPDIALQNPVQMYGGKLFQIVPGMNRILLSLDRHGDERYQLHLLPLDGGTPEPLFAEGGPAEEMLAIGLNREKPVAYVRAKDPGMLDSKILAVDLRTLELESLGQSPWVAAWVCADADHSMAVTCDEYSQGDEVLYRWDRASMARTPLAGLPPDGRPAGYRNLSFGKPALTKSGALLLRSSLFSDTYSPCLLDPRTGAFREVAVEGLNHSGSGELHRLAPVAGDEFFLEYNIDGCSHGYVGDLHGGSAAFRVTQRICGEGALAHGVLHSFDFARTAPDTCQAVLCFSTATSPAQLFRIAVGERRGFRRLTDERIEGIPESCLSPGEDASFTSFDDLRVSARLYLPSEELGFAGQRPLLLYIHGGPQGQERPDFTWFSMPLIQYLALSGFAVFVPNIRGSSGYGLGYMMKVHKDWGGADLRDLLHGLKLLEKDERLDSSRRGALGRSYGGFMTTCLLSRHPDVLQAGINLFGLCDLIGFTEGMPESIQQFRLRNVGDPAIEEERQRLLEHSATTHFQRIRSPLMFIQGTNDPRALPRLTLRYVETLRGMGKNVEYLGFDDEGHDIIKRQNKAVCHERIVEFFQRHLGG